MPISAYVCSTAFVHRTNGTGSMIVIYEIDLGVIRFTLTILRWMYINERPCMECTACLKQPHTGYSEMLWVGGFIYLVSDLKTSH